jgi:hypothetical protein
MSDRRRHRWFPSTTFQTPSPPSTSPIPTSASLLQADKTPSYTYPFTPGALHHATRLIPRLMAHEGYGNMMACCPALSTILSSSPPSALPVQTRAAQSLASLSATTTVLSSFSTLMFVAPRVSMVLPSGSARQARYGLMCP